MPLCRNTLDAALNEIVRQAKEWSTREWTRRVKGALIQLREKKGYIPYPNLQQGYGEFLYDVTWLETIDGTVDGRISHVPLVAEIEWGNQGDVWYDFQKLLVARAGVRVMIFNGYPGLLEELRAHVIQVARNGDRYLLAQYVTAEKKFAVEAWCLRVPD